mmetsp:Transcript_18795/g.46574  ORF Transcript_18795/g.46574 Transcript_18795/m.46574 type:complete len:166 (+) Transcript_18795:497-994(+)
MRVYKVDQTGPKMVSGGVHDGNEILRYHANGPRVARMTKGVPINPPRTCPIMLIAMTAFGELEKGRLLAIDVGAASSLVVWVLVENEDLSITAVLLAEGMLISIEDRKALDRCGTKNNAELEALVDCPGFPKYCWLIDFVDVVVVVVGTQAAVDAGEHVIKSARE